MIAETIPAIKDLTREQKLALASELWEQAAGIDEDPRDEIIFRLLEKRWSEAQNKPEAGGRWEELRDRLLRNGNA